MGKRERAVFEGLDPTIEITETLIGWYEGTKARIDEDVAEKLKCSAAYARLIQQAKTKLAATRQSAKEEGAAGERLVR